MVEIHDNAVLRVPLHLTLDPSIINNFITNFQLYHPLFKAFILVSPLNHISSENQIELQDHFVTAFLTNEKAILESSGNLQL